MIYFRSRQKNQPPADSFLVVSGQANECVFRLNKYEVDLFPRGREVARGVLRSSPKLDKCCVFANVVRKIDILFIVFYTPAGKNINNQAPCRRPQRVTGHAGNIVTRQWVRSPNECASVRFSLRSRCFCQPMYVEYSESRRFQ